MIRVYVSCRILFKLPDNIPDFLLIFPNVLFFLLEIGIRGQRLYYEPWIGALTHP